MFNKKASLFWTFLGILIFLSVIYLLSKHSLFIEQILYKSGALAPIVSVILYPLLSPTPITTDPITIIVGVIYGPLIGVLISFIGNLLAGLTEYYIGSRIEKATNFRESKNDLPFGLGKLPVDSVAFLIFGRLIPVYGGKIISILAGMYKVPIKRYVWTTIITCILGSILLSYGGFGLVKLIKVSRILSH